MKKKYILLLSLFVIKSIAGIDILTQGLVNVTIDDLDGFAYKIPDENRAGFFASPERLEKTLYTILNMKHIIKYGNEENYINREDFIIKVSDQIKQIFPENNIFDITKENKILLVRDFLEKEQSYMQVQKVISDLIDVNDLEELAEEKYLVNKSSYIEEETRNLEFISVLYNKTNKKEQYYKAKEIFEELDLSVESFESLKLVYKNKNVDVEVSTLDKFKYDKRNKVFSDEMFSIIKTGVYGEIIDFNNRFIITKLNNVNNSRQKTLQEVKSQIMAGLVEIAEERAFNSLLISLTQDKIEVNREVLETLKTRYNNW